MLLNRKKSADKAVHDRQRVINYKKFFGSPEGKDVIFDLMNRYHVLNSHKGDPFKEGQRDVVLYILTQTNMDMVQFDKLLKGEFNE